MPTFECPECSETFNSRRKRNEHIINSHDGEVDDNSSNQRETNGISQKKIAAIVFGTLMAGLPLGAGVFYASFSQQTPDTGGGTNGQFTSNPPVGNQYIPEDGSIPQTPVLSEPLSKKDQVYTLLFGGSQQIRRGVRPAALLQYSCKNCPNLVSDLEKVATTFNTDGTTVYIAPYYEMNETIALTTFRTRPTTYPSVDTNELSEDLCNRLGQLEVTPLHCIEDKFTNSSQ